MGLWSMALFILAGVALGVFGQAWGSWLEHQRKVRALKLIEAELAAGRQPPPQLYDRASEREPSRGPRWSEIIVFGALSAILWFTYFSADIGHRSAVFAVAAVACLAIVFTRSNRRGDDEQ